MNQNARMVALLALSLAFGLWLGFGIGLTRQSRQNVTTLAGALALNEATRHHRDSAWIAQTCAVRLTSPIPGGVR